MKIELTRQQRSQITVALEVRLESHRAEMKALERVKPSFSKEEYASLMDYWNGEEKKVLDTLQAFGYEDQAPTSSEVR